MKRVTLQDLLKKLDVSLGLSANSKQMEYLPYKLFRKVLMVYPEWPTFTSERTVKEKYKLLQELGILNDSGRINYEEVEEVLGQ